VPLSPSAALELAVVLPPLHPSKHASPLIGIPLVLPMGWKYSPPFFCAYTETATDLANAMMRTPPPLHPLQQHINTIPVTVEPLNPQALQPHPSYMFTTPLQHSDVYMDDFIGLAQAPTAD